MTYQQMGWLSWIKQIIGWVIFIPALLSSVISGLNFLSQITGTQKGFNAVVFDFIHVMIDILKTNTNWLDLFWNNVPLPVLGQGVTSSNIFFGIIYWLIFVGIAFTTSAARIKRQVRRITEGLEDQLILEKMKGETAHSRQELEQKISLPHHTIFSQIFILYLLPVMIGIVGCFILDLLGIF